MSQSGNGKKEDVKPSDIDIFEKIENENPLTEDQRWFKENLGTGEREIEVNPPELDGSQDEPQEG
ncbi:MAG: hypothetical protein RM049_26680 [Nostoc sp. DedQUE04]|uniref:hypothetical protein n=1 Tax=Nostoc sp. DedQUE04 TaxID=3075390 RepID=UPI002AD2721E|nr:hypothetical protein [Nostoc sp. DedQUE04]MDZ8138846.1 hypothetical protein [Nostoc sp. DedQUE04]